MTVQRRLASGEQSGGRDGLRMREQAEQLQQALLGEICHSLTQRGGTGAYELQGLALRVCEAVDQVADIQATGDRSRLLQELRQSVMSRLLGTHPRDAAPLQAGDQLFRRAHLLLGEGPVQREVTDADVEAVPQWMPAAGQNLDLDELLFAIVNEVATRSPWPRVGVTVVDREKGVCSMFHQSTWMVEDMVKPVWPLEDSISPLVMESGQTLVIEDVLADEVYVPRFPRLKREAIANHYRSVIIVPLPLEGAGYAMWFCGPEPHQFTEAEITYATTIAHCTAVAIRNARLAHAGQQTNQALQQFTQAKARERAILERMVRDQTRMTKMVLDGRGLSTMAAQVSELLGNPVVLYDKLFRCMVAVGEQDGDLLTGSDVRPDGDRLQMLRQLHGSPYPIPVLPDPRLGLREKRIIAQVVVGEDLLGYLHVLERRRSFDQFDLLIMQQAALVFALELMKEKIAWGVEMRLQSDVLSDLLFGDGQEEQLLARSAILGLNFSIPTRLLLVRGTAEDEAVRAKLAGSVLDAAQRALRELPGQAIAVLQRGDVVLLQQDASGTGPSPARLAERVQVVLERLLPSTSILIGIGRVCQGIRDIRRVYKQAKRVLDAYAAIGRTGLVPLESMSVVGLLAREETAQDLIDFAGTVLRGILEYDRRHNTALVPTLTAFLEQGGNMHATARALFIHLSTLRYRLDRVATLAGVNLRDPQDRFKCQLALQVYSLFGGQIRPG